MEGKLILQKILFKYLLIFLSKGCPRLPTIGFDPKVSVESVDLCEKIPNVCESHMMNICIHYVFFGASDILVYNSKLSRKWK